MEEIHEAPASSDMPKFESYPDPKPPENNPETEAGNEPEPDTIAGVNPSTNQAPESSSSIQPNAGQPQNTGGNLQAGGGVPTGGDSGINSLLNQGLVSNKPLDVGVAGASTESSTAPANSPPPANNGYNPLFILLILAVLAGLLFIAYRKQKRPMETVSSPEFFDVPMAAAPRTELKKQKKKKKPKKPNHH